MDDPRDISLNPGWDVSSRRDIYALVHIANIIRKNVLHIAPDVDAKSFVAFLNGPNYKTRKAFLAATNSLPKTITKSVVNNLGRYRMESKDNVGYSSKLDKIFSDNYDQFGASDFFVKNLTTARCSERLVFVMNPYVVFRYDVKSRDAWLNKCRFIWCGVAFGRFPALLPVVAAQIILYTIKLFIKQSSLTRKEELSFLVELIHFLPGIVNVAKPRCGVGLSVWYREIIRHRRIVLEAFLNEAQQLKHDIKYFNAPFSMMMFASKDDIISFIEHELKLCDENDTTENEKGRKRIRTEKDPFGDDTDVDEEDKELLRLGGYGGDVEDDAEVEMEDVEEVIEEEYARKEEDMDDDTEEYSETFTEFRKIWHAKMEEEKRRKEERKSRRKQGVHGRRSKKMKSTPSKSHLTSKLPADDKHVLTDNRDNSMKRCMDNEKEDGDCRRTQTRRETSSDLSDRTESDNISVKLNEEREVGTDDEMNEAAIRELFDSKLDVWDEEEVECEEMDWDPYNDLSNQDVARGFLEAQNLLLGNSQTIGSSMNLNIPIATGGSDGVNDDSNSSGSLPMSISPPARSGDDTRDGENGRDGCSREMSSRFEFNKESIVGIPPPHIQRAPWKKIREEDKVANEDEDKDDDEDEDEITWVETKIMDNDDVELIEERVGPNGGTGPERREVKIEEEENDKENGGSQ